VPLPAPEPLGLVFAIMPPLALVPLTSGTGAGVAPVAESAVMAWFVPCWMLVPWLLAAVPVVAMVFCRASISALQVPALAFPAASNRPAQTPNRSACLFMMASEVTYRGRASGAQPFLSLEQRNRQTMAGPAHTFS
jgi:hypothetical protein